jgi:DNA replicative helicase MCM subunit Mcm2 (Cdc46/Mcm family)
MLDKPDAGRDRLISEHIMRRSTPAPSSSNTQHSQQHSSGGGFGGIGNQREDMRDDDAAPSTLTQRIRNWIRMAEQESDEGCYGEGCSESVGSTVRLRQRLLRSPEVLRKYIAYSRRCVIGHACFFTCMLLIDVPCTQILQSSVNSAGC